MMSDSALKKARKNLMHELLSDPGHPNSPSRQCLESKDSDRAFVIIRRPKPNQENLAGIPWDTLPDELLLRIFSHLCLPGLVRVSRVCKRWYHLSQDGSLWQTLDLGGVNLHPDVTVRLLSRGVIAFRCPRSVMEQPLGERLRSFPVKHMDLSNSVINVSSLHGILSECSKLQNLSLEGLQLSDPIVNTLAQNENLVRLNLCGCSGFSESAVAHLLSSCCILDELNLSWCFEFTKEHVKAAVAHLPATITQLNISGYRKNLRKADLRTLIRRCPNLIRLDLSDSIMIKQDCFPEFFELNHLQHLSLSRCYDITPESLLRLGEIATLKTLQVYGIVSKVTLRVLRESLPHLQINCDYFTTIARPTIDNKKSTEIWGIKCRLTLQKCL
ncbi:S-phase kinase-associated protein 2-like [Arvicola amphibius]|uniref:LOW QUALITY PROTEIN: S-phase kinase-associated protein 2-like n=1 Tax=Arvicola amphibius TaxID=1047088 RepID=UPI0018E3E810|nr:LOW QUALITY PROTEIN: S-phase kinase-associated protein 2-like [Arvicola amphibius]XP_038173328.1 S-phase kinase-associated protein 2-like [Arvicola amphibius]XP_038173330.1 S-phase kinase-associated protein 2-like [Arvicola amphibius]